MNKKVEDLEKTENWEALKKQMEDKNISTEEQELITKEILHKESEQLRLK